MPSAKSNPLIRWLQPYCLLAVATGSVGCYGFAVGREGSIYVLIIAAIFAVADGAISTQKMSKAAQLLRRDGNDKGK
jgi:hypothetical protein